jgi:hypothetical protein
MFDEALGRNSNSGNPFKIENSKCKIEKIGESPFQCSLLHFQLNYRSCAST